MVGLGSSARAMIGARVVTQSWLQSIDALPLGQRAAERAAGGRLASFCGTASGSLSLAMAISSQMRKANVGFGSSARERTGRLYVTPDRSVAVAVSEF